MYFFENKQGHKEIISAAKERKRKLDEEEAAQEAAKRAIPADFFSSSSSVSVEKPSAQKILEAEIEKDAADLAAALPKTAADTNKFLPHGFFDDDVQDQKAQETVGRNFELENAEFEALMAKTKEEVVQNSKDAHKQLDNMRKRAQQEQEVEFKSRIEVIFLLQALLLNYQTASIVLLSCNHFVIGFKSTYSSVESGFDFYLCGGGCTCECLSCVLAWFSFFFFFERAFANLKAPVFNASIFNGYHFQAHMNLLQPAVNASSEENSVPGGEEAEDEAEDDEIEFDWRAKNV